MRAALWILSVAIAGCGAPPAEPAVPARKPAPLPLKRAEAPLPLDLEARSAALVDALRAGQYARVARELDAKLGAALDAEKLGQAWTDATSALGAFRSRADVRAGSNPRIRIVTCEFERGGLDVKLVFDADRRISGLWLSPAWAAPEYVARDRFDEREVTVGSAPWAVPGTLALPKAASGAAGLVLVHGSGPHDRDETIGPNKPFKDLAWGLASRGIAVLRYDKRTRVHLESIRDAKAPFTVNEETVDDAVAAAALLRKTEGVDPARVFVLGHSMGGAMLPRISARDAGLAGFIGLAAASQPVEDAIVAQFRYIFMLDGKLDAEEKKKIAALEEQAKRVKALKPGESGPAIFGAPPSYWLDLRGYDPVAATAKIDKPLLLIQGGRDYQVTRDDFGRFERALGKKKNVELRLHETLNHLFVPGEGPSTPAEYDRAGHVDVRVIDDVARFIDARR